MHQEKILQLRRGDCKEDPSNSRGGNEGQVSTGHGRGARFDARDSRFFQVIITMMIRYIIAIWK